MAVTICCSLTDICRTELNVSQLYDCSLLLCALERSTGLNSAVVTAVIVLSTGFIIFLMCACKLKPQHLVGAVNYVHVVPPGVYHVTKL